MSEYTEAREAYRAAVERHNSHARMVVYGLHNLGLPLPNTVQENLDAAIQANDEAWMEFGRMMATTPSIDLPRIEQAIEQAREALRKVRGA